MDSLDGGGRELVRPSELGDDFFTLGVIRNGEGHASLRGSLAEVNTNAVFDAARRMSQCVRIISRMQFVTIDYDGVNTHLWYIPTTSLHGNTLDLFAGIRDAIVHEPAALQESNEWLIHFEFSAYHPSPSSVWKPEAYADIFPWNNRALFYAPEIANDASLLWHVAYGQAVSGTFGGNMIAEGVDALNYARTRTAWVGNGASRVNQMSCGESGSDPDCEDLRRRFYKSCPLYKAPYEIDAAETVTVDGTEMVKITIRGRLQTTYGEVGGAPATFTRDLSTWVDATIEAEPFRTDENALRVYARHIATGRNPTWTVGDQALNSTVHTTWGLYPSIYPTTFLVKLVPFPGQGTPLWHGAWSHAEMWLRVLCEGFVDPTSTGVNGGCVKTDPGTPSEACSSDPRGLFDYTFQNCCLAAFGERWFPSIATEETALTALAETRPGRPQGFGPLPTLDAVAEQLNKFAAFIDMLVTVRLDLPLELQSRGASAQAGLDFTPSWYGAGACYHEGTARPPTPDLSAASWGAMGALTARQYATLGSRDYIYGLWGDWIDTDFGWYVFRDDFEWRIDPTQDLLYAIPEAWRTQVNLHTQVYGSLETGVTYPESGGTEPFACGDPECESTMNWSDVFPDAPPLRSDLACQSVNQRVERSCVCTLSAGMTITAPASPSCLNFFWDRGTGMICAAGGSAWTSFTPFGDGYLALTVPLTDAAA